VPSVYGSEKDLSQLKPPMRMQSSCSRVYGVLLIRCYSSEFESRKTRHFTSRVALLNLYRFSSQLLQGIRTLITERKRERMRERERKREREREKETRLINSALLIAITSLAMTHPLSITFYSIYYSFKKYSFT